LQRTAHLGITAGSRAREVAMPERVSIPMTSDLAERLKRLARRNERSIAYVARKLLEAALEQIERAAA
jgi:predicted DNA-binding protein